MEKPSLFKIAKENNAVEVTTVESLIVVIIFLPRTGVTLKSQSFSDE